LENSKHNGLHSKAITCPHCGVRISNNHIYCGWSEVFGCHGVARDWPTIEEDAGFGQPVPLSPQGHELLADIKKDQKN
jgi:hypothetical protein